MQNRLTWRDFHEAYTIEVKGESYTDVRFDINTPLYVSGNNSISTIQEAFIRDRHTHLLIKRYHIELNQNDIRSTHNKLRSELIKDFCIVDNVEKDSTYKGHTTIESA